MNTLRFKLGSQGGKGGRKKKARCIPLTLHQDNSIWIKDLNVEKKKKKKQLKETRGTFLFIYLFLQNGKAKI